jgi:small subunit ribosomal protein S21
MKGMVKIMPGIILRNGEPIESALKRFKRVCERNGVLAEIRKNKYFEKPSERKKRELSESIRKHTKNKKN